MAEVIFILRKTADTLHCLENCLEKVRASSGGQAGGHAVQCLCLFATGADFSKVDESCTNAEFSTAEQVQARLIEDQEDNTKSSPSDDSGQDLPTRLHSIADSQPYAGSSLQVILILEAQDIDDSESFIPLGGALLRLWKWHNARLAIVKLESCVSPMAEQIAEMTDTVVHTDPQQLQFTSPRWEGMVSIRDNMEDNGHEVCGLYLECDDWVALLRQKLKPPDVPQEKPKGKKKQVKVQKKEETVPVFGRNIEILQEVDLRTVPWVLLDSFMFELHNFANNATSLHSYIQELDWIGLLARLRLYPDKDKVPTCGEIDFMNTAAWKERIMNDYQNIQAPPEVDVCGDVLFLYFVLLPGLSQTSSILAKVLLSPHQINPEVTTLIENHQLFHDKGAATKRSYSWDDSVLGSYPVLQAENLHCLLTELSTGAKDDSVLSDEENTDLDERGRRKVFEKVTENCILLKEHMARKDSDAGPASWDIEWIPESSLGLSVLPERHALEAREAASRKLQRYLSMDSHPATCPTSALTEQKSSSPGRFKIDDVLSLLKKDGLQIQTSLGCKKLVGRNLCRVDSQCDLGTPWPDSQSMRFHDIYYYNSEEDLKFEKRYARIRDKGYFNDTGSSFLSPQKKKKSELPKPHISPVRSSPRRRASLLMTRSKSEVCPRPVSRAPLRVDPTFKQPQARPFSRSPRKRQTSSTSTIQTPEFSDKSGHKPISSRLPSFSLSASQPVRRSPRKQEPKSRISDISSMSASSLSSQRDERRHSLSSSQPVVQRLSSSSSDISANSSRTDLLCPRKRLVSATDFDSEGDQSLTSTQSVSSSLPTQFSFLKEPSVRRSPRKMSMTSVKDDRSGSCGAVRNKLFSSSPFDTKSLGSNSVSSSGDAKPSKQAMSGVQQAPNKAQSSLSQESAEDRRRARMKRSERHKMKLEQIINTALEEKGVGQDSPLHAACLKNVFNVSMVLLKTLPNSQNLTEEMKNVVNGQVQQIINLEKRRCGIAL